MEIKVNNTLTVLPDGATIADMAKQLSLSVVGVALAVNNKMVPRTEWDSYVLKQDDVLVVIKAACGG